jgi:hypothetical protein
MNLGRTAWAAVIAAGLLADGGPGRAEIYPREFAVDYVRTCTAAEGLQQYDRATAALICRCVVKFMEFKLPYKTMLEEFQKAEKGQRNRFDAVLREGGGFCEKLLTEP